MLADGMISMHVVEKLKDSVRCEIVVKGTIRSKQGINLPGTSLSVSSMRPEDVDNALWAARNNIDFISLSFVRSAQDVLSLKNLLASMDASALVIAKIEKREALEQLEAIVDAADGVMVARGDLGVEIDVPIPCRTKKIIRICREKLKPVIVATQMLESMHHNRRPTRAEASDVANAILDGADACMLSGENRHRRLSRARGRNYEPNYDSNRSTSEITTRRVQNSIFESCTPRHFGGDSQCSEHR